MSVYQYLIISSSVNHILMCFSASSAVSDAWTTFLVRVIEYVNLMPPISVMWSQVADFPLMMLACILACSPSHTMMMTGPSYRQPTFLSMEWLLLYCSDIFDLVASHIFMAISLQWCSSNLRMTSEMNPLQMPSFLIDTITLSNGFAYSINLCNIYFHIYT